MFNHYFFTNIFFQEHIRLTTLNHTFCLTRHHLKYAGMFNMLDHSFFKMANRCQEKHCQNPIHHSKLLDILVIIENIEKQHKQSFILVVVMMKKEQYLLFSVFHFLDFYIRMYCFLRHTCKHCQPIYL